MIYVRIGKMSNKSMENKSRIMWIDMARGAGIILVILGHMGLGKIGMWIYTFHIPLFFFLSGYVFNADVDFKTLCKNRIRTIIVPYFFLGIPIVIFNILYNNYDVMESLKEFVKFVIQRRMYTVWFLACLFCVNILFWIYINNIKKHRLLGIIIIAMGGCLYTKNIGINLPWNLDVCFQVFPFFYMGYGVKKYNGKFKELTLKGKLRMLGIGGALNILTGYINYKISCESVDIYANSYGNYILFYISAITGIFMVVAVAQLIDIKIVRYIGENSLIIFAWHQKLMLFLAYKVLNISDLWGPNNVRLLLQKGIVFIAIIIILLPTTYAISNSKLKFMVGK